MSLQSPCHLQDECERGRMSLVGLPEQRMPGTIAFSATDIHIDVMDTKVTDQFAFFCPHASCPTCLMPVLNVNLAWEPSRHVACCTGVSLRRLSLDPVFYLAGYAKAGSSACHPPPTCASILCLVGQEVALHVISWESGGAPRGLWQQRVRALEIVCRHTDAPHS